MAAESFVLRVSYVYQYIEGTLEQKCALVHMWYNGMSVESATFINALSAPLSISLNYIPGACAM